MNSPLTWILLIIVCSMVIGTCIYAPYTLAFLDTIPDNLNMLDSIVNYIFMFDIFVNLISAY
jgi:hypothetical protein